MLQYLFSLLPLIFLGGHRLSCILQAVFSSTWCHMEPSSTEAKRTGDSLTDSQRRVGAGDRDKITFPYRGVRTKHVYSFFHRLAEFRTEGPCTQDHSSRLLSRQLFTSSSPRYAPTLAMLYEDCRLPGLSHCPLLLTQTEPPHHPSKN